MLNGSAFAVTPLPEQVDTIVNMEVPMAYRFSSAIAQLEAIPMASSCLLIKRLNNRLARLFGVGKQHHRLIHIEQIIIKASIACGQRALDHDHVVRL